MAIYNATVLPTTAAPPSNLNADYPGCVSWFQLMEDVKTNTTALVDKIGAVTGLAVVEAGAGDADAVAHALTTEGSAGNETYATGGSLLAFGTDSIILEFDIDLAKTGDNGGAILEIGDPFNSVSKGFHVGSLTATGSLQFVCRNAANDGTVSTTLGSSPDLSGGRKHACIVWDRTIADPGSIKYYVEGSVQATYALSGAVGTNLDAGGNSLKLGQRNSSALTPDCGIYNVRIWSLASIPANIALAVVQMAKNPDEFPSLLAGLS